MSIRVDLKVAQRGATPEGPRIGHVNESNTDATEKQKNAGNIKLSEAASEKVLDQNRPVGHLNSAGADSGVQEQENTGDITL